MSSLFLIRNSVDFAKIDPQYQVPEHKGPEPTEEIEGGKLYKGGCHCGAVTVAVTSKPFDETFEEGGLECNCSVCERVSSSPEYESLVISQAYRETLYRTDMSGRTLSTNKLFYTLKTHPILVDTHSLCTS